MKKVLKFVLILAIISMACNALTLPSIDTPPPPVNPTVVPETSFEVIDDIKPKLQELGGVPCEENEEL
ncbi:MAG: hypothetical protein JNK81_00850, partial [Anaerolineales bacterium]|nr:hypothetical protein [Anaerolineales bacterium]